MKLPKMPDKSAIFKPLYKLRHNVFNTAAIMSVCQNLSEFVFKYSKETALIMLVFNAISIITSHFAQISGLKKSRRENKDYLITQEYLELGLDVLLTIAPPFFLDNFLKKQIDGGKITTKSMREKMVRYVAPAVGAGRDDLYHTDHLTPARVQWYNILDKVCGMFADNKKTPTKLKDKLKIAQDNIKSKLPDVNAKVPTPSLEDIVVDFEERAKKSEIPDEVLKHFYHGSAYEDIWGMRSGLLVLSAIGYTILASCVITPVIKNKIANYTYAKQLEKIGETKESIKRKERFAFTKKPAFNNLNNNVFMDMNEAYNQKTSLNANKSINPSDKNDVFKSFASIASFSGKLRI